MKKRANPDSESNIRRIDTKPRASKQTHGFQVHFLRGSRTVSRMFSDAVHGGKEAARKAARKFKRSAVNDLPERAPRGLRPATTKNEARAGSKKPGRSTSAKKRNSSRRK